MSFRIQIASDIQRDIICSEIFFGDDQFAEIHNDNGKIKIAIFAPTTRDFWEFDYSEMANIVKESITAIS